MVANEKAELSRSYRERVERGRGERKGERGGRKGEREREKRER